MKLVAAAALTEIGPTEMKKRKEKWKGDGNGRSGDWTALYYVRIRMGMRANRAFMLSR